MVVKVTDGDTVTVLTSNNKQEKVRLNGIDASKKSQDFAEKSKQYLSSLVACKTVRVEYKSKDRYGRFDTKNKAAACPSGPDSGIL
jgi:endonuclease YncB( thermonuclease family)